MNNIMSIKYKDFYHMLQPETKIVIINNQMKEIYRGKGFLLQDTMWEEIKNKEVVSAGLASDAPEFIVWLS